MLRWAGLPRSRPGRALILAAFSARTHGSSEIGAAAGARRSARRRRTRVFQEFRAGAAARSARELRADRVGHALLHMARFRRAREILLLRIRLAGRRRVLLAFRHEALERGAGELLVRG